MKVLISRPLPSGIWKVKGGGRGRCKGLGDVGCWAEGFLLLLCLFS